MEDHKQVIILRKDLNMRKGKMVAQGAHASLAAILNNRWVNKEPSGILFEIWKKIGILFNWLPPVEQTLVIPLDQDLEPWINGLFKKICVSVNSEQELLEIYNRAIENGVHASLIRDSGLTEFNGIATLTAVAVGPAPNDSINNLTGHLPLL